MGKLIDGLSDGDAHPFIMVGGSHNLYINPKTYSFRAELLNPDNATYSLSIFKDGNYVAVDHKDEDPSYLFKFDYQVESQYQSMPILTNSKHQMYKLDVLAGEQINSYGQFKVPGLYSLKVNLKEFVIEAKYIPQ